MRAKILFPVASALLFGLVGGTSAPAHAGLIGSGTNTVSALFFLGAPGAPSPPYTSPAPSEIEDYVNSMGMTTNSPPPDDSGAFRRGRDRSVDD